MTDPTQFVIEWSERMMKNGWCGCVGPEALAEFMGEAGNESPSFNAVIKAKEWEGDEQAMKDYIVARQKWCASPTLGCLQNCAIWKEPWANRPAASSRAQAKGEEKK